MDNTKVFLVGDSNANDLTNAIYVFGLIENYSISTWDISTHFGNLYIRVEEKKEFIASNDLPRCVEADYLENVKFIEHLKSEDEVWFASSWKPWEIELIMNSITNIEELTGAHTRVIGVKISLYFNLENAWDSLVMKGITSMSLSPKSVWKSIKEFQIC